MKSDWRARRGVNSMFSLVTTLVTIYLIGTAYRSGRQDGSRSGWAAAWRKLRRRHPR